jgi:hypothetical protein
MSQLSSIYATPLGSSSNQQSQSSQSSSTSGSQVNPQMASMYGQLLGMNQGVYGQTNQAFQQGQSQLANQLPGIYGAYGQITPDVMNTLGMGAVLGQNGNWGVAGPAAQAIGQTYAQNQGQIMQQDIGSGLGNSSLMGNQMTQNALSASQAYGGLGAQLAQTAAGYQAQIPLAQLGAQMQGAGMQSNLAAQYGGTLGRFQFANTAGQLMAPYSQSNQQSTGSSYGVTRQGTPYGVTPQSSPYGMGGTNQLTGNSFPASQYTNPGSRTMMPQDPMTYGNAGAQQYQNWLGQQQLANPGYAGAGVDLGITSAGGDFGAYTGGGGGSVGGDFGSYGGGDISSAGGDFNVATDMTSGGF